MDSDDVQIGRLLSRREVLVLLGGAGLALAVGCSDDGSSKATPTTGATSAASPTRASAAAATSTSTGATAAPACVVVPALTEGPYFVDEKFLRSDIRSDSKTGTVKDGTPLALTLLVSSVAGSCAPLAGATVDVWHCDGLGVYSDTTDPGFNTVGQNFLRGYQAADAQGLAKFTTIYPGWYQGRAVHIHFKIRTSAQGQSSEFTSQLFFDDGLTDQVHQAAPYAQKGQGRLLNSGDQIFNQSNGLLTLAPTKTSDGYAATFEIGLQA